MNEDLERARQSRDYSTLRLWTLDWNDFAEVESVRRIRNIHGFDFSAHLSGLGRWTNIANANRIALHLQAAVEEALSNAEFANIPALVVTIESERITFTYEDPEYGFNLYFDGSGAVVLRRGGSSLQTFHYWYTRFMPSMPGILTRAIAALDAELERSLFASDGLLSVRPVKPRDEAKERVRVLSAGFYFRIICHKIRYAGRSVRNLDVMTKNVASRLPDKTGRLSDAPPGADVQRYGRMDYKVSLRHEAEPCITQFLTVEAPRNSGWSGLFFDLAYVGENYTDQDGKRIEIDSELFLSSARCADAYVSFFRDMAIEGFLSSVTAGHEFETTSSTLS
ncbi:hypothetical protein [Actinoplanes campanulatus]|nr:hypothetical protein [Actinoplanes capillaceus]